jgi:WD40 repeat protein
LTFFNAKTGGVLASHAHAYATNIFQVEFSPNGKLLATVGGVGQNERGAPAAKVWDLATYKKVIAPIGHTELVLSIAFSPDSKMLATCGVDDSAKFWDTTTWREVPPFLEQKEYMTSLAFSPNRRTLATACSDGTLKLWNVATRHELASLKLGWSFLHMTFSPDGQTFAAECWDHSLRLLRAPVPDQEHSRPRDD